MRDMRRQAQLVASAIGKVAAAWRFRFRKGSTPTMLALVAIRPKRNRMAGVCHHVALVTSLVVWCERQNERPHFAWGLVTRNMMHRKICDAPTVTALGRASPWEDRL